MSPCNARNHFLALTDPTNWDLGDVPTNYFNGYQAAMEAVHQGVMDFWPELEATTLPEPAPDLLAALVAQERVEVLEDKISDLWARRSIEVAQGFVRIQTDERLAALRQECNEAIEEAKALRKAILLRQT